MATSSVSALDQDTYQLIATNTTTSGSTSSFSSLGSYKKLMLTWEGVTRAADGVPLLTFNGSSSNYIGSTHLSLAGDNYQTSIAGINLSWSGVRTLVNGCYVIENTNNGAPKLIKGEATTGSNDWPMIISGSWLTADSITSMSISAGGSTFSAGSMKLYGIAG